MNLTRDKLIRWSKLISTYFFGQGLTQLIQLFSGFLLINWLTKGDYATFTLVMAIHSTTSMLVELGVTQSMSALIGRQVTQLKLVGRYVTACRFLRNWMLLAGSTVLLLVFAAIAPKYDWSGGLWGVLWLSVVLSLVFKSVGSIYAPIFLLRQEIRLIYIISVVSGGVRLALIALAYVFGLLSAPVALLLGAAQNMIDGLGKRYYGRCRMEPPPRGTSVREERRAILSQAWPRAPGFAFFAFEGQIVIFLMSALGTTSGIAEIGALSRIGMLFLIFNRMGHVLVNPYFAKLESGRVAGSSLRFLAGALGFSALVAALGYLFPQVFLWVLGDTYQHLRYEVFLMIATSAVRLVDIFVFSICVARKYIYAWFSIVDIVPLLLTMVIALAFFDLSSVRDMLYFGLAMITVRLLSKLFILAVGLSREPARLN